MDKEKNIDRSNLSSYLLKQIRDLEGIETYTLAEQLMKSGKIYAFKEVYKEFFL